MCQAEGRWDRRSREPTGEGARAGWGGVGAEEKSARGREKKGPKMERPEKRNWAAAAERIKQIPPNVRRHLWGEQTKAGVGTKWKNPNNRPRDGAPAPLPRLSPSPWFR